MDVDGSETDTPPHTIKNISFMDAASLQRQPLRPHIAAVYRECMKNHAAEIGGHAVDGCGEFMQSPSSSAAATSLACAACGCHRNFHRRDPESTPTSAAITPPHLDFRHPPLPKRFSLSPSPSPSPRPEVHAPQVLYGLAEAAAAEDSRRIPITPVARKRHRTRFSEEQKEKMQAFAAESGWRIQKSDEAAVREFCREVGVPRGVLKVWMHNNKNTFCKKEIDGGGSILNDGGINFESSGGRGEEEKKCDEIHEHGSGVHFNGSSSS